MDVEVKPYDLPDAGLIAGQSDGYRWMTWEPQFTSVILGQSK